MAYSSDCSTTNINNCVPGGGGPMVMGRRPTAESCRATWAGLNDQRLLAQCAVDTYRASGPGGQKRNKTSSAVRLRHLPSGLIVIAEESRSQHENRARAFRRLRHAPFLQLRHGLEPEGPTPERRP